MLLPPRFVRGICARAPSQRDARPKKKVCFNKTNGAPTQMAQPQASLVPAFLFEVQQITLLSTDRVT